MVSKALQFKLLSAIQVKQRFLGFKNEAVQSLILTYCCTENMLYCGWDKIAISKVILV